MNGEAADKEGEEAPARTDKQKLAALKQVYRNTVKERPRNMVGLAKELPAEEMRALILQDMAVPASAWQELAAERAQNVRDYLLGQGVEAERVFLGSPSGKAPNPASPAVLLNISVQ